jgi:formylglycine-generating enzyme required for sulfatase activity
MSWQSSISAMTARYGNIAQKVATLVAKTLVPGAGVVVDLVESAFDVAKTAAKDQQEALLLAKTRANVQDLERLGELLGHLTGDMAKVCAKAETLIEEDMPEKVQGAVLRALQDDPSLMAAQRKMEQVCRQMSRIEEQNSELIEGMKEMRPLVGRIGGVADYAEDMKQAGVNGRFFAELMQKIEAMELLIRNRQPDQAITKLRELPSEVQVMPSVLTLEAGARVVAKEYVAAATLLQKATRLKPNDTELGDLSRAATRMSGMGADTKLDFPSLIPLKRFNTSDVIDGFTLTARLGSGGWGQVFQATRDGQTKALKIMHPELSQNRGVLDRFKAEIRTLMRLPVHPNLVRIEEFGYCTTQNCWYLVMDYIDGPTLDGYLKTNGAMAAGLVKSAFQPVAEALGAAHAIGIVHRDIKPGNMVFRRADKKLVLIDFGLANDSNDAGKAQVDGKTVSFAAPEQLRGRSADSRSDVFSLAATMHFALEYADRDRREPDHFSAANAPAELRDAMVRSMASWGERFAHAGELALVMKKPTQEKLEEQRRADEKAEAERRAAIVEEQRRVAAPKIELPKTRTFDLGDGVDLEMVLIPAGTFMMGSPDSEEGRSDDETQHEVTISKPFYLGKYSVTQAQWQQVMGTNPSEFKGDKLLPVENVSWEDAQAFCLKLQEITQSSFGIPTEAQWEYACRAGTNTPFHFGSELNGRHANCNGKVPYGTETKGPYLKQTSAVGTYPANAWGLYDMHGNVWELCSDWQGDYPTGSVTDPIGPATGSLRVSSRGGGWRLGAVHCRSANRRRTDPSVRGSYLGFRVALSSSLDYEIKQSPVIEPDPIVRAPAQPKQPAAAPKVELPKTRTFDLGNSVNLEMVLIPAGTFMMGSPQSEAERNDDETQHQVTISKPFYMGKYPVTQAQWQRFVTATSYKSDAETSGGAYFWNGSEWKMDPNKNWKSPGYKQQANHPLVCVSWNDVQQFLGWLNSLGLKDARNFQSPSEAQWEYACRAGSTTPYHFGNQLNGTQANCCGNNSYGTDKKGPYLGKTTPVGKYPANAWGLNDMHGNVWEWCADRYGDYPTGSVTDPNGSATGSARVFRGGSWYDDAVFCRSANRNGSNAPDRYDFLGFRVAMSSSEIPK